MITMRRLGKYGRFANQLFQYAFLRIVSGGDYQCAPWIGQSLFGHKDPAVTRVLPTIKEVNVFHSEHSQILGKTNINIEGYFTYHTSFYSKYKDMFRSLFEPVAEVRALLTDIVPQEGTVVGIHIRRGDYSNHTRRHMPNRFYGAPTEWYRDWLTANMPRLTPPVFLYLASDEPDKVKPAFPDSTTSDVDVPGAPFYADFYALTQCDVVLICNSSFGFAASMLNTRATEFWRPNSHRTQLVTYDPWDAPVQNET